MPAVPPTSPRFGAPRYVNADLSDFGAQVNGVTDQFDTLAARIDSGLAAAPPAAGIVNRFYRETDTGILRIDTGSALAHITPGPHAIRHQDGGADALTVREAMMATGSAGPLKGTFSVYRNAAHSRLTGEVVIFDTETADGIGDVSGWYDPATGRFTPLLAGVYSFSWTVGVGNGTALSADSYWQAGLAKNGAMHKWGSSSYQRGTAAGPYSSGSARAVANGTTDYFDVRVAHNQGVAVAVAPAAHQTFFQGNLIGRL